MNHQSKPWVAFGAVTLVVAAPFMWPASGWAAIEVMTVTTRKAEENIQDIPVSVTAIDAGTIEKRAISTTGDVVKLVPGVQFDQSFSAADTRISIRGINSERGRTSAAVLVDGIDVSGENITAGGGSSLLNTRLLDLERIEVVKGPQSGLYGRNAFAGAISYITRQPSMDDLEIRVYGDGADYSTYDLRGSISGPIVPGIFAMSFNAGIYSTDGYYDNNNPAVPAANVEVGGAESTGARLVALVTPSDSLSVTASISYTENESEPRAVAKVGNANTFYLMGTQLPAGTVPTFDAFGTMDYGQWLGTVSKIPEAGINLSISERTGAPFAGSEDDTLLTYLKVDWDMAGTTFKSLTSYLKNEAELQEDAEFQDGTGTFFMGAGLSIANDYQDQTDTRYFNQEFTLESGNWDRGRWLVGVSGFWEETENVDTSLGWFNDPNLAFAPGICGSSPFQFACGFAASAAAGVPPKTTDRDTTSYSAFGLVGFDITEDLRLTVEARYIRDEIEVTTNTAIDRVSQYIMNIPINFSFGAPPVLPAVDKQTSDTINPRIALDYSLTENAMLYGSVAKGTKPAGFGTSQFALPQNSRIRQEKLWAYELGAKTGWLDDTLQANVAVFFNQYEDRQVGVTVTDPNTGWPAAGIVNAAEAETKGIEIDLLWRPIDPLTLGLGYAYVDAEWTEFDFAAIRANSGGVTPKDMAICGNTAGNCSGAEVAGIPENALSLLANFTAPLTGDMEWFINTVAQYQDERAVYDRVNTAYIDSFWNVDAQLGVQTDTWSVQLYADNLFDDDTVRWGQGYQDFRDGMYGGMGGQPRDETVFGFLPPPRVIGLRATYRFGSP